MRFERPATQCASEDYLGAVQALAIRRDTLEAELARLLPTAPGAKTAQRLMPEQVMSYLGVVPSEHSSGSQRRLGPITKSGSQHARRLLVEAAWHYRRPPRISDELRRRQAGADPAVVALSWKAQRRLHHLWTRMEDRGKRKTIIAVAAARELAGFCWAVASAD